ncbi:MAG: adenylosuccinate lyase [Flavobacteriia bacterium]|nr:adenylosuccinate lyase [Flavobacteriia bacterium]
MIPRYKVQEIHDIWKTDNKLATWLKVELAHLESLAKNTINKTITDDELNTIKNNVTINVDRWKEIESETRHDLQAFVQMLEESVPDNSGRWIHYGLTSSDILDTSLVLICQESLTVVEKYCSSALYYLNELIKSDKANKRILSRTHGKAAEIQTYREIFTRWIAGLRRGFDAVRLAKTTLKYGKLSGASGNHTTNCLMNETNALRTLNLYPMTCSQIIPRDYFLDYFYAILKVVLAVEKIAYDIRIYSIDGVNEMSEPFRKGQKGSSAMPHKKNPILTENICGLARLYKSYMNTAVENCLTLLERDISHSASERIIFKDSAHIVCFILQRISNVFKGLNINADIAEYNVSVFEQATLSQDIMNKKAFTN